MNHASIEYLGEDKFAAQEADDIAGEKYEEAILEALADAKCIHDLSGSWKLHEYVALSQLVASGDLLETGYAYRKFCRNALERDFKTAADVLNYIEVCNS